MECIYNITAAVDADIAPQWAEEAAVSFLPALAEAPGVTGVELIEVRAQDTPSETRTYTVQVRFEGQEPLEAFLGEAERAAEIRLSERFGQKYVTFRLQLHSLHKIARGSRPATDVAERV